MTSITSNTKGSLLIAGGGGGATSTSNGGAGGSTEKLTTTSTGASGDAGGGGGSLGGQKGLISETTKAYNLSNINWTMYCVNWFSGCNPNSGFNGCQYKGNSVWYVEEGNHVLTIMAQIPTNGATAMNLQTTNINNDLSVNGQYYTNWNNINISGNDYVTIWARTANFPQFYATDSDQSAPGFTARINKVEFIYQTSQPSYGGSNYINTTYGSNTSSESGKQSGNGYVKITLVSLPE